VREQSEQARRIAPTLPLGRCSIFLFAVRRRVFLAKRALNRSGAGRGPACRRAGKPAEALAKVN